MPRDRLDKTLADYVVIAISPALIMSLVGSLVYFLLAISYRGQYETRMHWILFWFVFGMVLVERIAVQEGRERALQYGVVLFALVGFAVMHFVDAHVVAWVLMAIVWWCSAKLVWDCTLIDESEDASGAGLLQTAGINTDEATKPSSAHSGDESQLPNGSSRRMHKKSKPTPSPAQPDPNDDPTAESISDESQSGKSRPHAPGLWVMYFSLAALPLFGIGQLFIPVDEVARRSYAFQLLALYVASAISLLLTTSFLGLRRYLRQRMLEMPETMTRSWLGIGTVLMAVILLLALLIPRPQAEYSLTALIDKVDSNLRAASKFAVIKNDRGKGDGRQIGNQDPNAKRPGADQAPGKGEPGGQKNGEAQQGKTGNDPKKSDQSGNNSRGDQSGKAAEQSNKQTDPQPGDSGQQQDPAGQQRPGGPPAGNQPQNADQKQQANQAQPQQAGQAQQPQPNQPPPVPQTSLLERLAPLVKWILYGLLILAAIYLLLRYWTKIADFLAKLWAELLSLFGRRPTVNAEPDHSNQASVRTIRPFASYANPFTNGAADRMSPPQLVSYTFEALEAWAREQVVERSPEQTPLEFAEELGQRVPAIAKNVAQTTQLYMHIAYSPRTPSRDRLEVLERMWRQFEV